VAVNGSRGMAVKGSGGVAVEPWAAVEPVAAGVVDYNAQESGGTRWRSGLPPGAASPRA